MLISGHYHPSAPIHLLLSYTATNPTERAVFLTPRQDSLLGDLVDLSDQWLEKYSGTGAYSGAAQRTQILYALFFIVRP